MNILCKLGIHKDFLIGGTPSSSLRLTREYYCQCNWCERIVRHWGLDLDWVDKVVIEDVPREIRWRCL